jgi:hypothetical protein
VFWSGLLFNQIELIQVNFRTDESKDFYVNERLWLTLTHRLTTSHTSHTSHLKMTPILVAALLFAVLCPALNNALALPSSTHHAGRKGGFLVPKLFLHRGDAADIHRCCRGSLMIMRGGGNDDDESESDDYEYDVSSSSDEEETTDSSDSEEESDQDTKSPDSNDQTEEIELLQKQADLSQQSRNFGIATALWSSLFFDSILNKAKRIDLFPTTASIIMPASKLAAGFATAASVAFLLWRDYEIQSETLGGEESTKGDWFLSLSNNDKSEESEIFAAETRQKLLFHLSLFGLLNLACHVGFTFSNQAPFLGMSAGIINVHNTLVCVTALVKEEGITSLIRQALSWPLTLFLSSGEEGNTTTAKKDGMTPFLFRLASVTAWMWCIPTLKSLVALTNGMSATTSGAAAVDTINIANKARDFSLTVASLARLTLNAGVAKTLYSVSKSSNDSIRNHRFFATLSGLSSMIGFGLSGAMLYSSLVLNISASTTVLAEATLSVLFALVAGYYSVSSFVASKGTT